MLSKEFYEETPLYKAITTTAPVSPDNLEPFVPPIKQRCDTCHDETTWNSLDAHVHNVMNNGKKEFSLFGTYSCTVCKTNQTIFVVRFFSEGTDVSCPPPADTRPVAIVSPVDRSRGDCVNRIREIHNPTLAMKVAQYPPWTLSISQPLENALRKRKGRYKLALTCESRNYGIGAFSYYRNVAEDSLDELLRMVAAIIPEGTEREKYLTALETIEDGRDPQGKCSLVKDLIPISLRPEGVNHLGIMKDALGEEPEAPGNDDYLARAKEIRTAFDFFVGQLGAIIAKSVFCSGRA
ncbi:MAG: hypothetical protein ABSG53_08110 [Thermoguttaceae bacterium]